MQIIDFYFITNGLLQSPLLLGKEYGVGRVQLQEAIHIPKLALGLLYGIVDVTQRFSGPLVSPPISTVMPLIRLTMCHHFLKK